MKIYVVQKRRVKNIRFNGHYKKQLLGVNVVKAFKNKEDAEEFAKTLCNIETDVNGDIITVAMVKQIEFDCKPEDIVSSKLREKEEEIVKLKHLLEEIHD